MRTVEFIRATESIAILFNSIFGGMFPHAMLGQIHGRIQEQSPHSLQVDQLKTEVEVCPVLNANNFQVFTVFEPTQTANGTDIRTPTPEYNYKYYFLRPWTKETTPNNCIYEVVSYHQDSNGRFAIVTILGAENVLDMGKFDVRTLAGKPSKNNPTPLDLGSFFLDQLYRPMVNADRNQILKAGRDQIILPLTNNPNSPDEIAFPRADMNINERRDIAGFLASLQEKILAQNTGFKLFRRNVRNIQYQRINLDGNSDFNQAYAPLLQELPTLTPTPTSSPVAESTFTPIPTYNSAVTQAPEAVFASNELTRIAVPSTTSVHLKFNLPVGEKVNAIETNQLGIFPALFPALLSGEVTSDQELALDDIFGRIEDIKYSINPSTKFKNGWNSIFNRNKVVAAQGQNVELENLPGKPIDQIVLFSKESNTGGFVVVTYDPNDYIVPGQKFPKLYIYELTAGWWWTHGPADYAEYEALDAQNNVIESTTQTLNDQLQRDKEDPAGTKNITYIVPSDCVIALQREVTSKTYFEDKLEAIYHAQNTIKVNIVDNNGQLHEIDMPTTLQLVDRGFKDNPGDINIHGLVNLTTGLPIYVDAAIADKFKQDLTSIFGSVPGYVRVLLPSGDTFVIPRETKQNIIITPGAVQSPTPTPFQ